MRIIISRIAAFTSALLLAGPVAAQTLDEILAPISGTNACWQRIYSDEHLARHPRQKVTAIRISLSYLEMDHHEAGEGEYAFSVNISTRERKGFEGGLCHTDGEGKAICVVDCDGGAMSLRRSGSEGSILIDLLSGGVRLEECGSETKFWMSAEPDDKQFLVHPVACADDSSISEASE
jgi:hypothetical protein